MFTAHEPVMSKEVLDFLQPKKNQNFVDCTVGGAGHARAILQKTSPRGKLLGLDWDQQAVSRAMEILADFRDRVTLVKANYIDIKKVVYERKFNSIDGILLDLGLSSDQLQASGRGFSFQKSELLDMRFSLENDLTAEKILNRWDKKELIKIFREFGEEKQANKIAQAVCQARKEQPIKTTLQLVELIIKNKKLDKRRKIHPATQIFQALRIAVNNELENVKLGLQECLEVLEPGGRLAVITFHSLEDRIVKKYFQQESKDCLCPPEIPECRCGHKAQLKILTKKPVCPSDDEITKNFRSRSAKLRVIEKS